MSKIADAMASLLVRLAYLIFVPIVMMVTWVVSFGRHAYWHVGRPVLAERQLDGPMADGEYQLAIHGIALLVCVCGGVVGFFFGPWLNRQVVNQDLWVSRSDGINEAFDDEDDVENPDQLKLDL